MKLIVSKTTAYNMLQDSTIKMQPLNNLFFIGDTPTSVTLRIIENQSLNCTLDKARILITLIDENDLLIVKLKYSCMLIDNTWIYNNRVTVPVNYNLLAHFLKTTM